MQTSLFLLGYSILLDGMDSRLPVFAWIRFFNIVNSLYFQNFTHNNTSTADRESDTKATMETPLL
jgi:hypothetical protein